MTDQNINTIIYKTVPKINFSCISDEKRRLEGHELDSEHTFLFKC